MKYTAAPVRVLSVALLLGAVALPWAAAQGVYRNVGPDGKVTYSDQPPESSGRPGSSPVVGGPSTSAAAAAGYMPAELRQAMSRYPVTFYTGGDCNPCNLGRNYLNGRGIPYTERTVDSNDDIDALKRIGGSAAVPLLTIGNQHLKGFSEAEWGSYLDAAGYPKTSVLPRNYRRPAPTPLVQSKPVAPTTQPGKKAAAAPAPEADDGPLTDVPVTPKTTNPAGITF